MRVFLIAIIVLSSFALADMSQLTQAITDAETELRDGIMPSLGAMFAALLGIALGAAAVTVIVRRQ